MRNAFSDALIRLAADPRVLLLTGDHGYALFDEFRKRRPQQYVNAGIAEQNMVGMAAGLAKAGFIPFVYGLSAFVPMRVLEQIKLDIAHDNLHVILLGDGAGFVYSHLGTSHQCTEDLAVTRVIPQLTVLSPADRHEQTLCMDLAYACKSPVYLRMGKSDRGDVHQAAVTAELGAMLPVRTGRRGGVTILATGSMVRTAIEVAQASELDATIWSVPSIKPIDPAQLQSICADSGALITMEEHSVIGGLGSLVCEFTTAQAQAPLRVLRVGVNDRYSHHCGTYAYLLEEHGLDVAAVTVKVRAFVATLA